MNVNVQELSVTYGKYTMIKNVSANVQTMTNAKEKREASSISILANVSAQELNVVEENHS